MIKFSRFQSPIGELSILALKEGVIKISIENESMEEMEKWCLDHMDMRIIEGIDFSTDARRQIRNYLSGKTRSLNFPVVHINSYFRKKVLQAERKIPYGETRSYRDVAQMINNSRAFRAVGSANAENPLPLYFPCHRIICSDGSLGGFVLGLEVKQWLLNLEAR